MRDIYSVLGELGISYIRHDHPPLFTVEDAAAHDLAIPGAKAKSLFLEDKKGVYYLVILEASKRLNTKALGEHLKSKVSFASAESLLERLALTPGSVSPFGLINDRDKKIHIIIDSDLWASERLSFHPNTNTATLEISHGDFEKFLDWCGNSREILAL